MADKTIETGPDLTRRPVFFERNRVFRVYRGGKLFADFFGDEPEDGNYPEEWVASTTRALNRNPASPVEGISIIERTGIPFDRFIAGHRKETIGNRESFDLLVKILDSAIRLPVQAHPDKAFSRVHFNSGHGKTEAWIVLATREDACIYYGFKEGVTSERFAQAVNASETDPEAMPALLNRVPAKPGDIYLIPARMVHAIGAGCLILEVQEPTDFTVQPEAWCGDYRLSDHEMYLGLDHRAALDCFDFTEHTGERAIQFGRRHPKPFIRTEDAVGERIISSNDTPDFAVNRYRIGSTGFTLTGAPAIYVVTEGAGIIAKDGFSRRIRKGDYFFLPVNACGSPVAGRDEIEIVECLPPSATASETE